MLKQQTIAMLARHQDAIVRLACRIERAVESGADVRRASIMLESLCRDFQLMLHTAVALGESWELLQKSQPDNGLKEATVCISAAARPASKNPNGAPPVSNDVVDGRGKESTVNL